MLDKRLNGHKWSKSKIETAGLDRIIRKDKNVRLILRLDGIQIAKSIREINTGARNRRCAAACFFINQLRNDLHRFFAHSSPLRRLDLIEALTARELLACQDLEGRTFASARRCAFMS